MQIHQLKPEHTPKEKKRVGRGGKRGTTSGKGQKGQKSRAGHRIRPAERDLIQRLPKLKGAKNNPSFINPDNFLIKTSELGRFSENQRITKDILLKKGFIKNKRQPVKVLMDKEPNSPFMIEGLKLSRQARAAIEKAGGKIE